MTEGGLWAGMGKGKRISLYSSACRDPFAKSSVEKGSVFFLECFAIGTHDIIL